MEIGPQEPEDRRGVERRSATQVHGPGPTTIGPSESSRTTKTKNKSTRHLLSSVRYTRPKKKAYEMKTQSEAKRSTLCICISISQLPPDIRNRKNEQKKTKNKTSITTPPCFLPRSKPPFVRSICIYIFTSFSNQKKNPTNTHRHWHWHTTEICKVTVFFFIFVQKRKEKSRQTFWRETGASGS